MYVAVGFIFVEFIFSFLIVLKYKSGFFSFAPPPAKPETCSLALQEKILRRTVNNKASPPGRHQEQAPKQGCTFSSTTFSSVQLS